MTGNIRTIGYYTFIEAIRNRLFILTVIGLVCLLGIAEFTGELAITETREIQAVLLASIARWFILITTALFVISTMVREFNDKCVELILSLPISKLTYFLGKYFGFISLSLVVSTAMGLILVIYTQPLPLAGWMFSLVCESAIIISLSMLCLMTFNNITVSFVVVICFYLLSRSMDAIRLLSTSPILETDTFSQDFMTALINIIAYILPDLDQFTRSDWLVYGADAGSLVYVGLQTGIYLALLMSAGLFDLYRKEL